MAKISGIHHLAVSTANMPDQLEFFSDVLGMELVALYPMHGVEGATHAFLKAGDNCCVAFVAMAEINNVPIEIGKTHAGWGGSPCAPGTMQHVAFNVDSEEELACMRDRIRGRGVNVLGPVDHGFCKSIYFAGPEHLTLEVSYSDAPIDANAWVDTKSAAGVGISSELLKRLRHPEPGPETPKDIPQPPIDPTKPHMVLPPEQYRQFLNMPDADFDAIFDKEPPVRAGAD